MEKLLPCPFCGFVPKLRHCEYLWKGELLWVIECICEVHLAICEEEKEDVLAIWNKRFYLPKGMKPEDVVQAVE